MPNPSILTSNGYTYMVFTSNATVTLNRTSIDYLIIGGGGSGGKAHGGGGGAGRVVSGTTIVDKNTYNIVVGSGGIASSYTDGNSSSAFGITASGGGRGGGDGSGLPHSGGSGGGGSGYNYSRNTSLYGATATTASTTNDLGNNGGNGSFRDPAGGGGGGGGAGSIGSDSLDLSGGIGGSGSSDYASWLTIISNNMSQIWNTATNNGQIIASGGSGGSWRVGYVTNGPIGGGGNGGDKESGPETLPTNGIDNTGGGGGGGGADGQMGANGGSGLVIIRYIPPPCFKEGSKILTNLGYKYIEELRKGDMVKTLLNNYKPIAMIGKCDFNHPASKDRIKNQLYRCSTNKYEEVFEDLILTGCHSILVPGFKNKEEIEETKKINGNIYLTDKKYRLPACIDERTTVYETPGNYTIYHLALENDDYYMNYGIYANGLLVESCSKRYLIELSGMELV